VRGKDLQKFLASQQELLDRFTRQQGPGVLRDKLGRLPKCWWWQGDGKQLGTFDLGAGRSG
jgi:hypothetical protein